MTNDMKGQDRAIVAIGPANKWRFRPPELEEPRTRPEANMGGQTRYGAQRRANLTQAAVRLQQAVRRNPEQRMVMPLHHVNTATLEDAYFALKRDAAPGVDYRQEDVCRRAHRRA